MPEGGRAQRSMIRVDSSLSLMRGGNSEHIYGRGGDVQYEGLGPQLWGRASSLSWNGSFLPGKLFEEAL